MRKELGIIVVEQPDGKVGFQASESVSELTDSFACLSGRPGDAPRRVTLVGLEWDEDGNVAAQTQTKTLPMKPKPPPWGTRLGVGEMDEPEEDEDNDEGD